jgi:hypothetical protein
VTTDKILELIQGGYEAFNRRDIDAALAAMVPGVEWANGWEGGHVRGHAAVRDYWTRQWQELDPQVTPVDIAVDGTSVDVLVDQIVRRPDGSEVSAGQVRHRYRLSDGLIARMDIAPAG